MRGSGPDVKDRPILLKLAAWQALDHLCPADVDEYALSTRFPALHQSAVNGLRELNVVRIRSIDGYIVLRRCPFNQVQAREVAL